MPAERTLLPCPFCGSTAVEVRASDEVFHHVECDCGAQGPTRGTEDDDEEFGRDYAAAAKRDAISAWNTAPRRPARGRNARHG